MTSFLSLIFAIGLSLAFFNTVYAQPANWWKDTKGLAIESSDQLDYIIDNQREKFVLLDFYMQQCHWCYAFQAEWNQLVDDFQKWYGDQIIFAKVDGPQNYYLASHYKAQSYPTFVMLDLPAGEFSQFNNNQRTYASMKQWILQKIDGKLKPLPGQNPVDQDSVISSQTRNSAKQAQGGVSAEVTEIIKQIQALGLKHQKQLEELKGQVSVMAQPQHSQLESHNYVPYFLGGIIIGSILSFLFMTHLIKTKQMMSTSKKNKPARDTGLNNILSTGCEEDEEKYY